MKNHSEVEKKLNNFVQEVKSNPDREKYKDDKLALAIIDSIEKDKIIYSEVPRATYMDEKELEYLKRLDEENKGGFALYSKRAIEQKLAENTAKVRKEKGL